MEYEIILGLEIHMQLNTQSKMFCGCKNDPFFSEPNENVCPVCLGLPGAMPVPNKDALLKAQRFVRAVGSKLNTNIIYERKNYFYPDLPKGFQLTCPHNPVGIGGEIDLSYYLDKNSSQKDGVVRFREIHLEEDTAKSMHKDGKTFIDFNKSGVPLLEIVTEPDFRDIEFAVKYCKELQLIARFTNVSEADMEKGNMRLEANISVRKVGETELPDYRVELKNINSFTFMKKALQYEVDRQIKALRKGETLYQETRGFNPETGETFVQRTKEDAHDYRYFPEPDIPPIFVDEEWLNKVMSEELILPSDIRRDLQEVGLNKDYINSLMKDKERYMVYKELVEMGYKPSKAANLVVNEAGYKDKSANEIDSAEKEKESSKISSESELEKIIEQIVSENEKAVNDYKSGNENSLQFLIGQVMKATKGKADVSVARKILLTHLK